MRLYPSEKTSLHQDEENIRCRLFCAEGALGSCSPSAKVLRPVPLPFPTERAALCRATGGAPPCYAVSACLAGHPCRYDGGSNTCPAVVALVRTGRALPLCPEGLANLPVPRPPCEWSRGRVLCRDGRDLTQAFRQGAHRALQAALAHGCTAAILKSRSPSCGVDGVYDGTFSKRLVPGRGLFAALLAEQGVALYSEEALPPELAELAELAAHS